jgi:hypothetical protein
VTATPAPWTRAERTREIGYAAAMIEITQAVRELCDSSPAAIPDFIAGMPPEVAYLAGTMIAGHVLEKIRAYAADAFLLHGDPVFFSECVGRLAEGGYGTPPAEPGGGQP